MAFILLLEFLLHVRASQIPETDYAIFMASEDDIVLNCVNGSGHFIVSEHNLLNEVLLDIDKLERMIKASRQDVSGVQPLHATDSSPTLDC